MRAPDSWLRSYCDPKLTVAELADELAMHSIEVERITHAGAPDPAGFVVGKVLSVEKHPDADKLSVCLVDAGDGERTIVCGAPNVAEGQTVPVALPGAVMPDGTELGKAKLRGVESNGMILSEAELEIGDDAGGIAVLDNGWSPGTPLGEVIPVSEPVIELEPTSNRVDCFGIYGVAREVHAITGGSLAQAPWNEDAEATGEGTVTDYASVTVEVPELCPRFSARVFTDVEIGPSPLWLKARLIGAGMRPINNVVDITNYVMLMTAQPLHAFDLDKVPDGALTVRTAKQGERMSTLDGLERTFDEDAVLVCDRNGPSGIAGIMGGQVSEVSGTTTRVLLEVATWNGVNILRTSRKLGLRTDASNRFEKQLHPELALRGQRIASQLMVELCGAKLVPGTIDEAADVPEAHRLRLRHERVERLLGMEISPKLCVEYLERLDFEVDRDGDDLEATVPFHRHYDVTREVDLVEEVGRIHGYAENLPASLPSTSGQAGRLTREQRLRRRAEDAIRDLGFDAVVDLSLTDPGMPGRLRIPEGDIRAKPIRISNPLSAEHSVERTAVIGSLLDAASYNRAHGAESIALFESGRAYLREGGSPHQGVLAGKFVGERPAPAYEPWRIASIAAGPLRPGSWRSEVVAADFYSVKAVLEALVRQLGAAVEIVPGEEPFLHPGRSGRVLVESEDAGWIGELHPLVCREWDLESAAGFEVDLAPLVAASPVGEESYEDVITYPAVNQDVAVIIDESVPAAAVRSAVVEGGGELLRSAEVFDLYRGDQVGEERKSLALRLTFRAPDRTLTDEEVAERRGAIETAVEKLGGRSVNSVLVAGASGYAGALAAELVRRHPSLELARVTARTDAGRKLNELYPQYGVDLVLEEPARESGEGFDAAIVAYPHGAAAPVVSALRERGTKVVDLSADFRLHDLDTYGHWYGHHGAPELLGEAVYGLTELHRDQIAGADLVANPGCYPTASILALAPLAAEGLIEDVVIDAKSGVSGAGRAAEEEMAVVKESDDAKPYKVAGHRHTPEISQELAELAGGNGATDSFGGLTFVPHLMPFDQGELVSCYVRTSEPVDPARMLSLYEDRYADEPFIEVTSEPPGVSDVRGTNVCRIHLALNEASGRVLAFASIDNLWKGAASQAIQNLNLMLGLPEGEGIS